MAWEAGEVEGSVATVAGEAPLAAEGLETAARKLAAALGPRCGHVVVAAASAGEAEALLGRVEGAMVSYRCAWLDGDHLEPPDLLRALATDGRDTPSVPAAMSALVAEARAIGRPVVLVVRRADAAPAARLERLRLMVDAGESSDWLRLVLLGGPALLAALRAPGGRALASRVTSLIVLEESASGLPLAAASQLMQEPPRVEAERRSPHLWRIIAMGALGGALAAAAGPMFVRRQAPADIAVERPLLRPVAAEAAPVPELPPAPAPAAAVEATPEPPTAAVPEPAAAPPRAPEAAPVPEPAGDAVPQSEPAASPAVTGPPTAVVHAPETGGRSVQVGAFRDPARAEALRTRLAERFEWVMVTEVERDGTVWHRVRVEGLPDAAAVRDALAALRRAGYQPIAVR